MEFLRESLSTLTNEEVTQLQHERRQWNRELRDRTTRLVNSRISHEISHEEYLASREATKVESAVCEQQMTALRGEMARRARP